MKQIPFLYRKQIPFHPVCPKILPKYFLSLQEICLRCRTVRQNPDYLLHVGVITVASHESKPSVDMKRKKASKSTFVKMIHTFYDSIYVFCANQVSDPKDAEDLTQEVFVSAYANAHQLRDPDHLQQWLLSIAYNLSRRLYRQKYREKTEISMEDIAPNILENTPGLMATAVEEEVLDQPEFSPLYKLIDSMPDKARESLELRCIENMSYEDIAKLLNVPISTVKGRIYNARQWLLTNGLASSTPAEVRQQIAQAVTDVVRNYSKLREALSEDLLENQLILAFLHPLRMSHSKLKAYTFGGGRPRNIMLLMNLHLKNDIVSNAVIKADNKIAVSAFLQLLPEDKPVYITFTNSAIWDTIQGDYNAKTTALYSTYGLTTREHWKNNTVSNVSEVTSDKDTVLEFLSRKDPSLKRILECMKLEDKDYLSSLRLFVHHTATAKEPDAYAVFAYSGIGNLWELARYSPVLLEDNAHLQECIAFGSTSLLNQGYWVTVNAVNHQDTARMHLLSSIGFRNLFTQTRIIIAAE